MSLLLHFSVISTPVGAGLHWLQDDQIFPACLLMRRRVSDEFPIWPGKPSLWSINSPRRSAIQIQETVIQARVSSPDLDSPDCVRGWKII
jgi:hypothetical protein